MLKIVFILFFCITYSFSHHVKDNKKLMIAYTEDWAPYSYRGEDGQMKGILVDLVDTLLDKMLHIEIENGGFPWKRAQSLAEEGTYDAIIGFPSEERKKFYTISKEELISLEWKGFTSVNSKNIDLIMNSSNLIDLKSNFQFCSILGDTFTETLLKEKGINSHKTKNVDMALKVLSEGRTDLFINSKLIALNFISKKGLEDNIKMHPMVFEKVPFHFLLSNNSDIDKSVISKLDNLIKELKKNKKYDSLIEEIEKNIIMSQ